MVYRTDIDYSHLEDSWEDLCAYIKSEFVSPRFLTNPDYKFLRRAKIMRSVCKMVGIQPSAEQWIFLLADIDRLLCEACAGAGKTSMAQLKLVDAKLSKNIPGKLILALAYNNHAVDDMITRHREIITKLNRLNIPELKRDSGIESYTFHAFCKSWVEDYTDRFKIIKQKYLLVEGQERQAFEAAVTSHKKAGNADLFVSDRLFNGLISMYGYIRETLTRNKPEMWAMCPSLNDLQDLTLEEIEDIFKRYEKAKMIKRKMDFADLVDSMWELCHDKDVMARIRANYNVFLVDEFQDMTPAMRRVLSAIMNGIPEADIEPYTDAQLICIGDGDQSIYGFRGTNPDNCIKFKDDFTVSNTLVKIVSMSENRRCPNKIIDVSRSIIESIDKRIEKPIRGIREGGIITVNSYTSGIEQMEQLVSDLKTKLPEELDNTCICYRNLSSSYLITLTLMKEGIPFRFGRGNMPLSDRLSTILFKVLLMLTYPDDMSYVTEALYTVVPKSGSFKRDSILEVVQLEQMRREKGEERRNFWELEFPEAALNIAGFKDAIAQLRLATTFHRKKHPMSAYVPALLKAIHRYYLDWQLQRNEMFSKEYMSVVEDWFTRDISYEKFKEEQTRMKEALSTKHIRGVYLTTFHGLKGLEFDEVHLMDLNDLIFPGTELNINTGLSKAQKDEIENESRRLFYVACTRARKRDVLYFSKESPTRYMRFFMENSGIASNYKEYMDSSMFTEDSGFIVNVQESAIAQEWDLDLSAGDNGIDTQALTDFEMDDLLGDFVIPVEKNLEELVDGIDEDLEVALEESDVSVETSKFGVDKLVTAEFERDAKLLSELGSKFSTVQDKVIVKSILSKIMGIDSD